MKCNILFSFICVHRFSSVAILLGIFLAQKSRGRYNIRSWILPAANLARW
jgi:hypothetical protein